MRTWMTALMLAASLALVGLGGCDDDGGGDQTGGAAPADAGAGGEGGMGGMGGMGGGDDRCVDFPDEHTALLNAPTTATVIHKTPTHPPVGQEGLP
mgnify:CR=1 FL=1